MITFHIGNEIETFKQQLLLVKLCGASLPCPFHSCSYISKVDVLNILVAAAYRHVPSLDQILQPAAVTRLRNQLLEAEYYQLGVEVRQRQSLLLPHCNELLLPGLANRYCHLLVVLGHREVSRA